MRMCVWRTTSSPSVVNVIRRCLPFDSTALTVPPTTWRRAAAGVTFGATSSKPVTTRPASARRSTVAVRKIVSPSGIARSGARDAPEITARRPREAGLAQRVRDGRLVNGSAVDRLDEESRPAIGPDLRRQRGRERLPRWLGVGLVRDDRQELLLAATEPPGEPTINEDDQCAGGAHRLAALRALGPGQRRAIWVGRVRRREDDGVWLFGPLAGGAEPIDSTGQRELRCAEARHEVAAPDAPRVLHPLQDPVGRSKATADSLRAHDLACKDAVPLEQLADLGCRAFGRRHRRVARGLGERPASCDVVAHGEALEASDVHRAADRIAPARPAQRSEERAHRVEAVVRDLTRPDEIPECVAELWREAAARRHEKLREE